MNNAMLNRYLRCSLLAVVTLLTATACSTTNVVKEDSSIKIERVDSKAALVTHAYLSKTGDETILNGEIKRQGHGRGPIPGHLHVTLIDPQGNTIKEADISYIRRSTNSSTATFSTHLPIALQPGSTIKIMHFDTKTHETYPNEGMWRN